MIRRIPRVNASKEDDRCEKHEEALASSLAEEGNNDELPSTEEEIQTTEEELFPFQDILADQRRKYNPTQEYIRLIYNDLVKIFIKKWEGTILRKTVIRNESLNRFPQENEETNEDEPFEDDVQAIIDEKTSTIHWKLDKPDEIVEIVFVSGNSYTGRISKEKMEGQGLYRWHHGSHYQGAFEDNQIEGNGSLEWQDSVRYDGDFKDGYYHGRGTMVDKNYNLLYIGEWFKGHKHGKGYCRFEKNDSYDGDWVMGKREGVGNRVYPDGARYVGHWKNGLRHGTGTMTWTNGDVYEGDWDQGQLHGCGAYTWNRLLKKSLCWPQEMSYVGQWHQGNRDGRGQLTLNSIGGAKYSGEWKNNRKHGHGTIIGNNGHITEDDPLFDNNTLLPAPNVKTLSENEEKSHTEGDRDIDAQKFARRPTEIPGARVTSILHPEQRPSLRFYTDRLFQSFDQAEITSSSRISLKSGKCRNCDDASCRCLSGSNNQQSGQNQDRSLRPLSKESTKKEISSSVTSTGLDQADENETIANARINNADFIKSEEERWAYKCIAMHMPRIRKIFDTYSKIFCNVKLANRQLSMSRLSLWQLWRDCRIYEKSLSLVQIDEYLAANGSTLTGDPHCPYERLEIWQLIHALLEVSWHLCTKNGDIDAEGYPGRLANGLHKFLVNHIYPNAGNYTGILCGPERDLLSIDSIYRLYTDIGKPHTARQLLRAVCPWRASTIIPKDRNSKVADEKLSVFACDKPVVRSEQHRSANKDDNLLAYSLPALQTLSANEFIQIMSITCPSLKDPDADIIVDMEYKLTFLEFLEIFIEAGKKLARKKTMQKQVDRRETEAADSVSLMSIAKGDKISRSTIRSAGGSKSIKSRKKIPKNH